MKKQLKKKLRLVVLGSTGSVGSQALEVAGSLPGDVRIVGLSADRKFSALQKQITQFHPSRAAMADHAAAEKLRSACSGINVTVYSGQEGLEKLARMAGADAVLVATSGISGLIPSIAALESGKKLLTSNKESIVSAGGLLSRIAEKHNTEIIPVDSEHSAVFQLLRGVSPKEIRRVILTASGGPFLNRKNLSGVTPKQALAHPRWNMGRKTSVDSATLMNKGLEIIEAAKLFSLEPHQLDVAVHPQSLVHALVELVDGNILVHMAVTDMKLPIRYAITHPERLPDGVSSRLSLSDMKELTFIQPDTKKFPCLALAKSALLAGGAAPGILSAADEVAVDAFLKNRIGFTDIPAVVESCLGEIPGDFSSHEPGLEEIMAADSAARDCARRAVRRIYRKT